MLITSGCLSFSKTFLASQEWPMPARNAPFAGCIFHFSSRTDFAAANQQVRRNVTMQPPGHPAWPGEKQRLSSSSKSNFSSSRAISSSLACISSSLLPSKRGQEFPQKGCFPAASFRISSIFRRFFCNSSSSFLAWARRTNSSASLAFALHKSSSSCFSTAPSLASRPESSSFSRLYIFGYQGRLAADLSLIHGFRPGQESI